MSLWVRRLSFPEQVSDPFVQEVRDMVVSVSAVLLLGVLVIFFVRKSALKPVHAIICSLLGFYLASTSMAPGIQDASSSFAGMMQQIHF
jgi:hypothetical protein